MGKFNLPPATTIKSTAGPNNGVSKKYKNNLEKLKKEFALREFLKGLLEQGFVDPGFVVTSIYLELDQLGLLLKYRSKYNQIALVVENPEISYEDKKYRVYNKVKNWWLSLEGCNFRKK